jgi:hypothetical protein
VDFLKVDTDGHDIEVILGARNILASGVIGLRVEEQLHGSPHKYANTFSNIDRLLRERGFSLFDLDVYRYSRADLPAPFVYDIPAQTTTGQVSWGEALYLRDLGSPAYESMWNYEVTAERVMKLAALFDLFELPDCAAELLRNRAHFLDQSTREGLLDLLVSGEPGAYASLLARFKRDFTTFYPSRRMVQAPDVKDELEQRVATLRKRNALLRQRLAQRNERVKRLSRRLTELTTKT